MINKRLISGAGSILSGLLVFGICDAAKAEPGPYDGSWESLQKMPVPAWFDDGKIPEPQMERLRAMGE